MTPGPNLQIIAYYKPDGNKKQEEEKTFTVDFNPDTFTISNKIEFKQQDGKGKTGGDPQFDKIPPLDFTLEFTIDGSGAVALNLPSQQQNQFDDTKTNNSPVNQNDYVKNRIKELRDVTGSNINDTIHRPNYLAILWGTFYISCVLTSLNITYSLFDRNGSPLRAKVNCGFLERKTDRNTLESADLTKHISSVEGDLLPLIARNHYDDPMYYLQLAKVNKLKNFRNLSSGTKLVLPPFADDNE